MAFENFDFSNFWDDSDYAKKKYIGKTPTDKEILEIEQELGYKLPQSYIELIKKHNGGIPIARSFYDNDMEIDIIGIYGIDRTKPYSLCGDMGTQFMMSEWGYPNIGIAVADTISGGHDMIFLDYRECGKDGEPKVVVVDQESDYRIEFLADTFEDFIKGLTINATEIEDEEFGFLDEKKKCLAIKFLQELGEEERVIELLTYIGIDNLSAQLLGMLARSYNNNDQAEEAMKIMNMIPEEERDAKWYYRYGYSYAYRNIPINSDDKIKAIEMLEKAIEMAEDDELKIWCVELTDVCNLHLILETNKEKTPLLYKCYTEHIDNLKEKEEEEKTYKKITVDDVKNAKDSWDINEPMYWTINIYGSHEEYLKSAEPFTLEQRYLNAIIWYYIEVNNGGHHQFFSNSTGIVWEDALNGLKLFGMTDAANNLQHIVDLFGGSIPFDREKRWEAIENIEKSLNLYDVLDKADDFVYNDNGVPEDEYMKQHPEKFVFEGYYNKM